MLDAADCFLALDVLTEVKVSTRNGLENLRQTPNATTTLRNEKIHSKVKKYFNKNEIQKPKEEIQVETKEIQTKIKQTQKEIQNENTIIVQQRKLKLIALLSLKNGPKSRE
jgi:microcompartment protein CcmL/EutN